MSKLSQSEVGWVYVSTDISVQADWVESHRSMNFGSTLQSYPMFSGKRPPPQAQQCVYAKNPDVPSFVPSHSVLPVLCQLLAV